MHKVSYSFKGTRSKLLNWIFSCKRMEQTDRNAFEEIIEGQASMLYNKSETVFYNKVQVLNRDLSIQVITLFAEIRAKERTEKLARKREANSTQVEEISTLNSQGISVLDALAATGLRSIRYLKEIPGVSHVTINDLEPAATEAATQNVIRNGVSLERVTVSNMDACLLMYQHRDPRKHFDVIDLDPYGTAAPFLDPAVQAVADGGLLCVTCTDMPILSGNYPETCFAKYGCVPVKGKYVHEMSLRILLHAIDTAANRYKRHIVPWISVSVDFYVRVFVRVFTSPAEVKKSCLKRAYVYQSTQCPTFYLQPVMSAQRLNFSAPSAVVPTTCPQTGGRMKVGGPIWSDVLHKQDVVDELLSRLEKIKDNADGRDDSVERTGSSDIANIATYTRLRGLLTAISEELKDVPLYYLIPDLAHALNATAPSSRELIAAFINAGYRVSQSHREPTALKTDAPVDVMWDIMRCWYEKVSQSSDTKPKNLSTTATAILAQPAKVPADFTIPQELFQPKKKATRFPPNPESHWGPKRRAGRHKPGAVPSSKEEIAEVSTGADADASSISSSSCLEDDHSKCEEQVFSPAEKRLRNSYNGDFV